VSTLDWFLPVPEAVGTVDLAATYAYTGSQRVASSTASPYAVLDGFGILNFNLGWTGMFGSTFDLSAFVTNATDKEYVVFTSGTYRPLGIESRVLGPPRMFGARLRYNF
jgi:outer membrane receptor protein involved in Fe transport